MPRKPNYDFDRRERERLKAEKNAERAAEKAKARQEKTGTEGPSGGEPDKDPPDQN